jgi:hypothetical protein
MLIYTNTSYKPKKKRKPKGEIARKINVAKLHGEKIPSYSYGHRQGASNAREIKSLETNAHYTDRRESIMYTGTLVRGIATMHKSNAVPVINEEQMKDISRMRRG